MTAQILAVAIFLVMFLLIIMDKIERHIVTLLCACATFVLVFGLGMHSMSAAMETLNVRNIFTVGFWYEAGQSAESSSGINWATILFIAGMMIMVEGMARAGFFRWLCMTIAKAVKYQVIPIFITFMIMSTVLAMFIDSITVILFLAAVTVELAQLLKFNPVPMILSEVFCATSNGNIAKTVAMNVIWFSLGMIIVSQFCPAMTQIAIEQGVNLADYNAAGVSIVSFGVLCHPFIVGLSFPSYLNTTFLNSILPFTLSLSRTSIFFSTGISFSSINSNTLSLAAATDCILVIA